LSRPPLNDSDRRKLRRLAQLCDGSP